MMKPKCGLTGMHWFINTKRNDYLNALKVTILVSGRNTRGGILRMVSFWNICVNKCYGNVVCVWSDNRRLVVREMLRNGQLDSLGTIEN